MFLQFIRVFFAFVFSYCRPSMLAIPSQWYAPFFMRCLSHGILNIRTKLNPIRTIDPMGGNWSSNSRTSNCPGPDQHKSRFCWSRIPLTNCLPSDV